MGSIKKSSAGEGGTCPECHKPMPPRAEASAYPFCSERCQLVDLDKWLEGDYAIPGGEGSPADDDDES